MSEERPEHYGGDTFLTWGIFPRDWRLTDGGDYGSLWLECFLKKLGSIDLLVSIWGNWKLGRV